MTQMLIGTVGLAVCLLIAVGIALYVAWTALTDKPPASPEAVVDQIGALSDGDVFTRERRQRLTLVSSVPPKGPA